MATCAELKSVAERWIREVWRERRLDSIDSIHATGFVDRSSSGRASDRESYKEGVRELFAAFPDFRAVVEDLVAEAEAGKIAVRWTGEGTHRGQFLGIQPTGRRIYFRGIEILTVQKGLIVERWGEWDGIDLLSQLKGPA